MPRYFLEVAYKGTRYSGFQIQENVATIQAEVERALKVLSRQEIELTGSSRTDAGVHALQNYFHFDSDREWTPRQLYSLNAIIEPDVVIKRITPVPDDAHSRFHATAREYNYHIYSKKDPFRDDRAYFFPYTLDTALLNQAAAILMEYRDFTSFSKRNTQVKTFLCSIEISQWHFNEDGTLYYHVKANRFLRGMVRGLVATMLKVGRGALSLDDFRKVIEAKDCSKADFSAPGHGLFLVAVHYPEGLLNNE
ncbi:tRNA pseudouridine38-40 synthase [Filimonas lacunae]|uniref:tRNA pseudouridine synthase A n=1 Tax=Filimonas lacunae TaxID=477680 RepID=A0A173M9S2_9BACT|nr:tRNA pseudouridine(38-40) synthase TruA [Filimonas lacunae]BAV04269.1 tRNA pseudouridine synthase A [Filimonas lacunae]SIT13275.1 tRNA pseudouridine38-40 synthase [Filimonas lacunae]